MKANQWITDRLPQEEDMNEFGHIIKPDSTVIRGWHIANNQGMKLGDPWFPMQTMPPYIKPAAPDAVYWDKPSDFPPFCWAMTEGDPNCFLITNPSAFIKYQPMSVYRWAARPFDSFAEGSTCTK